MFQLYKLDNNNPLAFKRVVKKGDKIEVFGFLKMFQFDFSLPNYLKKLLTIDPERTVEYLVQRHGQHAAVNIVDTCIKVINKYDVVAEDKAKLKYLLLD
jgi:hypothetical protein